MMKRIFKYMVLSLIVALPMQSFAIPNYLIHLTYKDPSSISFTTSINLQFNKWVVLSNMGNDIVTLFKAVKQGKYKSKNELLTFSLKPSFKVKHDIVWEQILKNNSTVKYNVRGIKLESTLSKIDIDLKNRKKQKILYLVSGTPDSPPDSLYLQQSK